MAQQIVIDAVMRKTKDGCYRALCRQCGGQLSLAILPGRGGIQHENWVLVAPDSPEVSAAPGFSRRYDDGGQPVYSLIRPRFIKDLLAIRDSLNTAGSSTVSRASGHGQDDERPGRPWSEDAHGSSRSTTRVTQTEDGTGHR